MYIFLGDCLPFHRKIFRKGLNRFIRREVSTERQVAWRSPKMRISAVLIDELLCVFFCSLFALLCCLFVVYRPLGWQPGVTKLTAFLSRVFWPGIPAIPFGSAGSNLQQN